MIPLGNVCARADDCTEQQDGPMRATVLLIFCAARLGRSTANGDEAEAVRAIREPMCFAVVREMRYLEEIDLSGNKVECSTHIH